MLDNTTPLMLCGQTDDPNQRLVQARAQRQDQEIKFARRSRWLNNIRHSEKHTHFILSFNCFIL